MSSHTQRVCLDCGADLPHDSGASSCTRCLLEACFEEEAEFGAPESTGALAATLAVPGEVFGDYELLEEIARGGMGVVFKARQRSLDRIVAVKMLLPGRLTSRESVRRFRVEAEAASRLRHPGIVSIHDVGECEGQHFYSMDFIEGRDLARRVDGQLVSFELAACWTRALAGAIHHAHQRGILHRDLKPANVLIDGQDEPHVTDFGLAKLIDDARDLTATGHVLGTPSFMPPEQADPDRGQVTVASDIYGLGAILFFLLTGQAPFQGTSLEHTLRLLLTEPPTPPSRYRLGVPRDLETICLKCLSKEPQRRYHSAAELADDLGAWARREPIRARPVPAIERLWFWARRNPGLASLSVALATAVVLGALLQQVRLNETRRQTKINEGLIQYLLQDLTEQLRPLGRLGLLENVNGIVQRYYQGLPMQENLSTPLAGKARFFRNNASVLRELGRIDEAEESARSALELLHSLAKKEPANAEWPLALADAQAELREILKFRDVPAALQAARESVEFSRRACELEPGNEGAKARLALARIDLGAVLQDQGTTAEAADEIRAATQILEALSATGPNAGQREAQLALTRYYQGLIDYDQGHKDSARQKFAEYLERSKRLAQASSDAGDAQAHSNLADAHAHLGRALYAMQDHAEALEHFQEYQRLAERMERLDPGNVNFRRELAFSLDWLALELEQNGRRDEITPLLTRACDISQKLARDFPRDEVWQEHSARSLTRLAVWLFDSGSPGQGRALLAEEVARRWTVLLDSGKRPASHSRFLRALAWSEQYGGPPDALTDRVVRLRDWLAKAVAAASRPGADREWNRTEATLRFRTAEALVIRGDFDEARREYQTALPLWQQLSVEQPKDSEALVSTAQTFCGLSATTAHLESFSDTTRTLRPFLDWLKTKQPKGNTARQILEKATALEIDLMALQVDAGMEPDATFQEFSAMLEQMKRNLNQGTPPP